MMSNKESKMANDSSVLIEASTNGSYSDFETVLKKSSDDEIHRAILIAARNGQSHVVRALIHHVEGLPVDILEAAVDAEPSRSRYEIVDLYHELWTTYHSNPDPEIPRILGKLFESTPNIPRDIKFIKFDWAMMTGNLELLKELYAEQVDGSDYAGSLAVIYDQMDALKLMADKFDPRVIEITLDTATYIGHQAAIKLIAQSVSMNT